MVRPRFLSIFLAAVGLLVSGCDSAEDDSPDLASCNTPFDASAFPAATVSFQADVVPILANYSCSSSFCHGGTAPASNFSVKTAASIMGPGDQAKELDTCDVIRGQADNSYLVKKITGAAGIIGSRMPLDRPEHVTDTDLQVIKTWIREGARDN